MPTNVPTHTTHLRLSRFSERKRPGRVLLFLLPLLLSVIPPGVVGDVFTSSQKIQDMEQSEHLLIQALAEDISGDAGAEAQGLYKFLFERLNALHYEPKNDFPWQNTEHPNGGFLLIKLFCKHWLPIINARPSVRDRLSSSQRVTLPTEEDYEGALSSLVRLQHVYHLEVADVFQGNYLGYQGPALSPPDTYLLGRRAFSDGYMPESARWLELALRFMERQGGSGGQFFPAVTSAVGTEVTPVVTLSMVAALLGRAVLQLLDQEKAQEMYKISSELDPESGDVSQLRRELDGEFALYKQSAKPWDHNLTALCLRPKQRTVGKILPIHVCRYKRAFGSSYLMFKEEILSITPYASLFYDVIRDDQIDSLKDFIKDRMYRGMIGEESTGVAKDRWRTSDIGWIGDIELSVAAHLSQKIKLMTRLEVDQRFPTGPCSSEALQIVNYGLGGLYDIHVDPFMESTKSSEPMHVNAGNRIATFLMYLSDVEMGGSTVFVKSDIAVAPKKGMALFWYNFDPDMNEIDMLTTHAGCPVLIGQKWVANKWVREYGNTFMRPCGPQANSTQLQVEQILS